MATTRTNTDLLGQLAVDANNPLAEILRKNNITNAQIQEKYDQECARRDAAYQAELAEIADIAAAANAEATAKFEATQAAIDAQRQRDALERQRNNEQLERDRLAREAAIADQLAVRKAARKAKRAVQKDDFFAQIRTKLNTATENNERTLQAEYAEIDKQDQQSEAKWHKNNKKLNTALKSEQEKMDAETEVFNKDRENLEQLIHDRQAQITVINTQLNATQPLKKAINPKRLETSSSVAIVLERKQENESTGFTCWGLAVGISAGSLFLMICAIHPVFAVLILKTFCSATTVQTLGTTTLTGLKVGSIGLSAMTFFGGVSDLVRYCNKNDSNHRSMTLR